MEERTIRGVLEYDGNEYCAIKLREKTQHIFT